MDITESIPDKLDEDCSKLSKFLDSLNLSTEEKIDLLEQMIDYLSMDLYVEQNPLANDGNPIL